MFKKLNDFFKKIDEKILKGGEEVKQQTHNFKGERFLFFLISKKISQKNIRAAFGARSRTNKRPISRFVDFFRDFLSK